MEKIIATVSAAVSILAVLVPVGIYLASIGPHMSALDERLTSSIERGETRDRLQDERFARLDESRTVGLQRLAKVEEAVSATKEALSQINAKLDRVLTRR